MSKHKIDLPPYTMIPNVIIDGMGEMTECQFRVLAAIARKTFGWQKQRDVISLSQLEKLTGLSRQGVSNGIQECIAGGWIARVAKGQSFEYELLVNDVDQSESELVNVVDQLPPQLVNVVDTQKKEPKEKESTGKSPVAPPAVEAYRRASNRYPAKSLWLDMSQAIGEDPTKLELWEMTVKQWILKGWRPDNIGGMFDIFKQGGFKNDGHNGKSPARDRIPVNNRKTGGWISTPANYSAPEKTK